MSKTRNVLGPILGAAGAALICLMVYFLAIQTSDVHGRVLAYGSAVPVGGAVAVMSSFKQSSLAVTSEAASPDPLAQLHYFPRGRLRKYTIPRS
jgi:hypothetical protein